MFISRQKSPTKVEKRDKTRQIVVLQCVFIPGVVKRHFGMCVLEGDPSIGEAPGKRE